MTNANEIRELTVEELGVIGGGGITVVADKDYFGIEISAFGHSVGVWFTQGSACGKVDNHSGCTP